jgi:hypothetical protein
VTEPCYVCGAEETPYKRLPVCRDCWVSNPVGPIYGKGICTRCESIFDVKSSRLSAYLWSYNDGGKWFTFTRWKHAARLYLGAPYVLHFAVLFSWRPFIFEWEVRR